MQNNMTMEEKIELKGKILTELYNSNQLQDKLVGIMYRHRIPKEAELADDIIQTTFEYLHQYDTDKMIQAYQNNPKRVLALGVTIMLRKCILKDNRYGNVKHSLTQYMLFGSTFNSNNQNITPTDTFENYVVEDVEEEQSNEIDYNEKWEYIISKLNKKDQNILNKILNKQKVPNKIKKQLFTKIKNL